MHFFSILASAGLFTASSVLAAPSPGVAPAVVVAPELLKIESIAKATAMGIDIFGSIPDDAVKVPGGYEAGEGTRAWAWIHAQMDLPADAYPVEKRIPSYLNLGFYTAENCRGSVLWINNAQYATTYRSDNQYRYSFNLNNRGLYTGETVRLAVCGAAWVPHRDLPDPGCYNAARFTCMSVII